MKWSVIRHERPNGDIPFDEFIEGLDARSKARVLHTIELLEEFGTGLREPYCKKIETTDLWELRVKTGANAFRVFYVAWTGRTFVLFNGFRKKTRKTPRRELDRARVCLEEPLRRKP